MQRCRSLTATDIAAALSAAAYHVLGLAKLKMYADAAAELGKLGDLDDPQYWASKSLGEALPPCVHCGTFVLTDSLPTLPTRPHCVPAGGVSLVPFALRWLQAELPGLAGQVQESIAAHYSLLEWCRRQRELVAAEGAGSLAMWHERCLQIAFGLAAKHAG